MKAIIWTRYGVPDGLELREIEKPSPRDDEVLIKIYASTVTAGDCEVRSLKLNFFLRLSMRIYIGFFKPKRIPILGQELSGVVEAVGKDVNNFKKGDQVFAQTDFNMGAYAEYICMQEKSEESLLALKPENMTFEEAATVPLGGLESLYFLRKAKIKPGEKVLINGCGGSIGTYGLQIAKNFGAQVTAVDSGAKLDMLLKLGANDVIDYTKQDFTLNGQTYDVIFDVVGKSDFSRSVAMLNEHGRYLIANPNLVSLIRAQSVNKKTNKEVVNGVSTRSMDNFLHLKECIEAGKLRSIIDRIYPLEETAKAHQYVESGQKKGNVVIKII